MKSETLRIKIETDGDGKTKASLAGVEKGLIGVDGAAQKASGGLSASRAALAGFAGFAGGYAVSSLLNLSRSVLAQASELHTLSEAYGVAVPKLSQLADVAQLNGVQFNSFTAALGSLADKMKDALINPTGQAAEYFKALGVSVADTNGNLRSVDSVLVDIAQRFAGAKDGAEKATIASEFFGKAIGPQMVPLLNQFVDQMGRVNGSISTEFAAAAAEHEKTLNRWGLNVKTFMAGFLTGVEKTFGVLTDSAKLLSSGLTGIAPAARDATKEVTALAAATGKIDLSGALKAEQAEKAAAVAAKYRAELERTAEAIKAQTDPAYRMNKELAIYDELLNKNLLTVSEWATATSASWDEFNKAIGNTDKVREKLDETKKELDHFAKQSADALRTNLSDTFYGAMTGRFEDVNDAFSAMLRKMLADAVAAQITKAIFGSTGNNDNGNLISAGISLIAGAFGGTSTEPLPPPNVSLDNMTYEDFSGGRRASGGDVGGGRPYLVGERGPELMVPGASGTVIPNHRLGGGGVTINQSFDFRGAQPGESLRLHAEAERIKADTIATFYAQIERGGAAARVVGRR